MSPNPFGIFDTAHAPPPPPWTERVIVLFFGATMLLCIVVATVLTAIDREIPRAIGYIAIACFGSLATLLTVSRGQPKVREGRNGGVEETDGPTGRGSPGAGRPDV